MRFRHFVSLISTTAFLAALPVAAQEANPLDTESPELRVLGQVDPTVRKATAIVNGEVITDTDVEQRLNLVLAANGGRIDAEERDRLRLQVLRNLIDEKLQIQEAKNNEITVTDAEVDQTFARVAQNFRQTPEQFTEFLKRSGSSAASMKQQIRGELAWSRLLRRRIEPFVNVGDDEVQSVIDRLNAAKGKDEYRVGEIFVSATPENETQVLADMRRIVEQVRNGASFVAYARQFSEASTAAVGGDLGWVRAEQLSEQLQPVVTKLTEGAVSDPIRVPGGFSIVALIDKRQVLAADPNDAVLSLKQLSIQLKPGMSQTQTAALIKNLQEKTQSMGGCGRAEEVGRALGADVTTSDQIRIRDLPAPLQTMMKTMQIGQSTPPFGSPQEGVRVLVLCGRDDAPVQANAPSFDEVYAQLNDERVGRAARRYLRDLRSDAIVDYR